MPARTALRALLLGAPLLALAVLVWAHPTWLLSTRVAGTRLAHSAAAQLHADGVRAGHVWWFVHLSDIHMSLLHERAVRRKDELLRWARTHLRAIAPCFVVLTGDLTDSKRADVRSHKFPEEWRMYEDVLSAVGEVARDPSVAERRHCGGGARTADLAFWYDARGNHDAFDVSAVEDGDDLFARHGAAPNLPAAAFVSAPAVNGTSAPTRHSYSFALRNDDGEYRFVYIDACPTPGAHRPLNFFGETTAPIVSFVERELAAASPESRRHTVAFSHYPLSTISSHRSESGATLYDVMAAHPYLFHLSGHLHTLHGASPQMHALRPTGQYELELGDWKDNRMFRVVAFDHDIFSFADVSQSGQPTVVVLSPKSSYYFSEQEPLHVQRDMDAVRVLAFPPSADEAIASVRVVLARPGARIACDGGRCECAPACLLNLPAERAEPASPLFVLRVAWAEALGAAILDADDDTFLLAVHAVSTSAARTVVQPSSLGGRRSHLNTLGMWVAALSVEGLLQFAFLSLLLGVLTLLLVAPLVARVAVWPRIEAWRGRVLLELADEDARAAASPHAAGACRAAARCCLPAASLRHFVWLVVDHSASLPLCALHLVHAVFLLVGPLVVGQLLTGSIGVVFQWAIVLEGRWIHTRDPMFIALPRLLFSFVPLLLVSIASRARTHLSHLASHSRIPCRAHPSPLNLWAVGTLAFVCVAHAWFALDLAHNYGTIALASPSIWLPALVTLVAALQAWRARRGGVGA